LFQLNLAYDIESENNGMGLALADGMRISSGQYCCRSLYGYSLDALVAFELARQLRRQNANPPGSLYALARPALTWRKRSILYANCPMTSSWQN
jgi:surfactin synthase thioesterase subunit